MQRLEPGCGKRAAQQREKRRVVSEIVQRARHANRQFTDSSVSPASSADGFLRGREAIFSPAIVQEYEDEKVANDPVPLENTEIPLAAVN